MMVCNSLKLKQCSGCKNYKLLENFPPDMRYKCGRASKCRVCVRLVREAYYAKYPEKELRRRISQREHSANWHQRNRKSQIVRMRWNSLRRKYGVTQEQYEQMLNEQTGICAICRTNDPGRGNVYFVVDHDHEDGNFRGLLCHPCNVALGMFKDNVARLRAAINYLEKHARIKISRLEKAKCGKQ